MTRRTIWRSLLSILQGIDNPVLIHYGAYETSFLKRLAGRYLSSIADTTYVEALIKRAINLLSITYSQIYFPTYSNGLKEVARHLGFQWSHPSASGLQSVIWRQQWEATTDPSIKQTIITYNKEDCEALELVTRAVERVATFAERRDQSGAKANEVCVHAEDLQKASKWRRFASPVPALEVINEAAHWDYQRDRVYVRNSDWRKRFQYLPLCASYCQSPHQQSGPLFSAFSVPPVRRQETRSRTRKVEDCV